MKKKVSILIAFIMLLAVSTSVFAQTFESINMHVEFPNEYYDLKNGIDNDDAKIAYYEALLKITKEKLEADIKENNILYYGKNTNLSKTLILNQNETKLTQKIFHLHLASEETIDSLKEQLKEEAEEGQMYVEEYSTYDANGIKWIKSVLRSGTTQIYQYYTIINGKAFTLSLTSEYTNVKHDELKEIIDTVEFTELQEKALDLTNYIIIAVTVILVIFVLILMWMAFSKKKE